jgi:hypothetical protein
MVVLPGNEAKPTLWVNDVLLAGGVIPEFAG